MAMKTFLLFDAESAKRRESSNPVALGALPYLLAMYMVRIHQHTKSSAGEKTDGAFILSYREESKQSQGLSHPNPRILPCER